MAYIHSGIPFFDIATETHDSEGFVSDLDDPDNIFDFPFDSLEEMEVTPVRSHSRKVPYSLRENPLVKRTQPEIEPLPTRTKKRPLASPKSPSFAKGRPTAQSENYIIQVQHRRRVKFLSLSAIVTLAEGKFLQFKDRRCHFMIARCAASPSRDHLKKVKEDLYQHFDALNLSAQKGPSFRSVLCLSELQERFQPLVKTFDQPLDFLSIKKRYLATGASTSIAEPEFIVIPRTAGGAENYTIKLGLLSSTQPILRLEIHLKAERLLYFIQERRFEIVLKKMSGLDLSKDQQILIIQRLYEYLRTINLAEGRNFRQAFRLDDPSIMAELCKIVLKARSSVEQQRTASVFAPPSNLSSFSTAFPPSPRHAEP